MLENSLREAFARRAGSLLAPADPAAAPIRRGRRVRRRRSVVGGLAAVLLLAGLVGGTAQLRIWFQGPVATIGVVSPVLPPPEPVVEPVPEPWHGGALGLELRLVNRMWTATGERLLLSGSALVEQAYRTPHGVVFGSAREVRLRREDGTTVDVLPGAGDWLVSPDGQRVVSAAGGTVRLARLGVGGVRGQVARAEVPEGTRPVAFWGTRVVLTGPDGVRFDVWDPAASYRPAWTSALATVYGPAGDDLLVLVGQPDGHCLAAVPASATRLPADRGDLPCGQRLAVAGDRSGWLAPGGGWLAVPDGDQVRMIEVALGGTDDPAVLTCPRHESVTPTWWSPTDLLSADEDGAVSCDTGGGQTRQALPERVGTLWEYVPAFGIDG
jgi:hypothetical protein